MNNDDIIREITPEHIAQEPEPINKITVSLKKPDNIEFTPEHVCSEEDTIVSLSEEPEDEDADEAEEVDDVTALIYPYDLLPISQIKGGGTISPGNYLRYLYSKAGERNVYSAIIRSYFDNNTFTLSGIENALRTQDYCFNEEALLLIRSTYLLKKQYDNAGQYKQYCSDKYILKQIVPRTRKYTPAWIVYLQEYGGCIMLIMFLIALIVFGVCAIICSCISYIDNSTVVQCSSNFKEGDYIVLDVTGDSSSERKAYAVVTIQDGRLSISPRLSTTMLSNEYDIIIEE